MFVSKISNYQNNLTTFSSTKREVYRNGKLLYKNKTTFFREDLDWNQFVSFLNYKYKDAAKVNVINTACSDGTESFSLAILLIEKLKSIVRKFFPIKSSDVDMEVLNKAIQGPCNISVNELYVLNKYIRTGYFKYFRTVEPSDKNYDYGLLPNRDLRQSIDFKQSDILTELENMQPQNNVIMCRNFWIYLKSADIDSMIKFFKENLDKTDTIVIGGLERGWNFHKLLEQAGFRETSCTNVFEKKE